MSTNGPPTRPASTSPAHGGDWRGALTSGPRPPRAGALSASFTLGWRAMLKIKHVPDQLFDVTAFPIMFTLIFTYLFGGAIAGSPEEYLQFLLPGIMVQTVVFTTVYSGFTINTDITKGVFDRFRSLPIWQPAVIVGNLLGDTVRYTIASVLVIALGLILGFAPQGGALGVVLAVVLLLVFSFAVSWIWTMLGFILGTPNSVMAVSFFILFPVTFASNIFVDPATMPAWLESAVQVNPVTLLTTAVRGLMHGTATLGDVGWVLLIAALLTAIFGPATMWLYRNQK